MTPFHVVLYSRPGCCLCDRAAELLQSLQHEFPHELHTANIDEDPVLKEKWRCHIPVIFINGSHRVALRITEERLRRAFLHTLQKRRTSHK
ncbi:MAG TPA: glutaredoxin family protein [Abditibacteriaceae bacterium]|jgi:glutaredoxin